MRELLRIFSHPEKGVFTVLVGGTKGKGSTAYFLSEILRHSGLRVGFYHSPHLESPQERIWINGRSVSANDFEKGLQRIKLALQKNKNNAFTYFEILTLLATMLFKKYKVEAAIYEVGMGGRLDATNTLPAKLVMLTPIHYDHEAYLGNTLTEIASEKVAIIRKGGKAVVAPQPEEAFQVIKRVAQKRKCKIWFPVSNNVGARSPRPKGGVTPPLRIRLLGDFQELNAKMALRAAAILRDHYQFPVDEKAMARGISGNHWPGRMELIQGRPLVLIDGAHNPKSIEALTRNVKRLFPSRRKIVVFGTSRDKHSERMLPSLGRVFDVCILTRSRSPRAKEIATLLGEANGHFKEIIPVDSPVRALGMARKLAGPQDLIVITGSFYLIGELRKLCRRSI